MPLSQTELMIVAPIVLLQVILLIAALRDLIPRQRVRGGNKMVWAVIIVLVNIVGPLLYFTFGREE